MINYFKNINFLLSKDERFNAIILSLFVFFGMVFEIFGLAILLPLITIILDPKSSESHFVFDRIKLYLDYEFSNNELISIMLISVVFLYFVKSLYMIFITYRQNYFLAKLIYSLKNKLFKLYVQQPFIYQINRDISNQIKNLQLELGNLYNFFTSLISVLTEVMLGIAVIGTIFVIEPFGAFSLTLILLSLSSLYIRVTKNKIKEWGKERETLDQSTTKTSLEAFSGIKEIIIQGAENFFIKKYSDKNNKMVGVLSNHFTVSQSSKFYLEFITVFSLVIFIKIMLIQGFNANNLLSTIGVFVAASFRLIPSFNRVISSYQQLKFYFPSVDVIKNEFELLDSDYKKIKNPSIKIPFKNNLTFNNVSYKYTKNSKLIIDNISFSLKKGDNIGFIGESGEGKSTLIDLLNGLLQPTKGEIFSDQIPINKNISEWQSNIGYVSQEIFLFDDSIINNIALGVEIDKIDLNKIKQSLKSAQLYDFAINLKNGLNTKVGERGVQISGGQRQRLGIARAMYNSPEILIFDEATSALDEKTEDNVIRSIFDISNNKTTVMIAHRLNTLKRCDKIYRLKDGKLLDFKIKK